MCVQYDYVITAGFHHSSHAERRERRLRGRPHPSVPAVRQRLSRQDDVVSEASVRPEVRRGGVQQVSGTSHELPDGL